MNFIEQVTYDLVSRGWDNLRNVTVVFPMHRAALFMKEELKRQLLAQQLDKPVVAPRFTTLSELTDELCAPYLQPDDEIRSVCMLHRIFTEQTHTDLGLDTFYGWGKQLLTDFSNADMSEADARSLFGNSADARQLEVTHLDEETRLRLLELMQGASPEEVVLQDSLREHLHALWRLLPSIYEEFNRQQRALGVGYTGARLKFVVEHFEELIAPQVAGRTFAFVGFNYLLGKERQLMELLQPQSLFYWDHDATFTTNRDAYKYTKQGIDRFGQSLPETGESEGKREVNVVATATSGAQAQFVHQWLQERQNAQGRVGIVIADETMLEPVIYALPSSVSGKVNITKGFPLRNTKVFADIVAYLSDKRHERREGGTYADVLRELNLTIAATIDAERQPEKKNWQQALIQESYYQAQVVLNRFCALIEDGTLAGITQLSTLRNLLRRHLETVLLPFHGDPVTTIQVIGVLETRLLDFEHLLVLNVEEGVLPKTAADNSFIPFYLRKYYHMPTGSESAEVYAHNFFRLLRRTKDATILFCDATDGNNKKSMSRFLMQIMTSEEFAVKKFRLAESQALATEELNLTASEVQASSYKCQVPGSKIKLSPSAINTYLRCPMRFYLQYVLGIAATEESGIIMQPNELGSLVHNTIHAAYEDVLGELPALLSAEQAKKLVDSATLDKAIEKGYRALNEEYKSKHAEVENRFIPEEHKAETLVARTHVKHILENDARLAERGLRIVRMEEPYYFTLAVPGVGEVLIGGYIDRIDEVDGHLRVLDYKTGRFDSKKTAAATLDALFAAGSEHGYMLQTFIYCMACADAYNRKKLNPAGLPVMPALLFSGKKEHDPSLRIGKDAVLDFEGSVLSEFRELLTQKVQEILTASVFSKCEDDGRCGENCPFALLCGR